MPGWDGYPIRERFAERYDAPVWVDNDVNLLAMGEWRSGVAAGHDNVVVVKVGTGIGAGIISDGHLHRGAQGSAGDVGHIQVTEDPAVICRCGNIGCLEALAGGGALGRAGETAALEGRSERLRLALDQGGSVSAQDVARAASFGDPAAVALLQSGGRRIGSMLASVVNFFNPSLVVIGGGVANSPDQFLASIREAVYRRSLPLATRDLLIQRSSLGGLAGVIGASSMVVDQLFARESIGRWIEAGDPARLAGALARAGELTDDPGAVEVDVAVVGGGSAGSTAAIASARAGASTLLIDALPFLGGTSTAVLDTFYGFFTPGTRSRKVVGGIADEVVAGLRELGPVVERPNTYGAGTGITYLAEHLKVVWERLVQEAGAADPAPRDGRRRRRSATGASSR